MSDQETPTAETADVQPEKKVVDPYVFLQSFPNAPTKAQIELFKRTACNGKVALLTPDIAGKRAFILRGLSAREWEACQKELPANTPEGRYEIELQRIVATHGTLWASQTTSGKLIYDDLMNSGAGLCLALYEKVSELSDFMHPSMLEVLSVEL